MFRFDLISLGWWICLWLGYDLVVCCFSVRLVLSFGCLLFGVGFLVCL